MKAGSTSPLFILVLCFLPLPIPDSHYGDFFPPSSPFLNFLYPYEDPQITKKLEKKIWTICYSDFLSNKLHASHKNELVNHWCFWSNRLYAIHNKESFLVEIFHQTRVLCNQKITFGKPSKCYRIQREIENERVRIRAWIISIWP